ncbi:MAG: ribbon-helix-helix domain-containing protein [Candidatus Woesearchaeota archaeon]
MNDIVSVRMPKGLVHQLKELSSEKHYLDLSELIRTIVRQKAQQYGSPYAEDVRRIITDLEKELQSRSHVQEKQALVNSLRRMIEDFRQ